MSTLSAPGSLTGLFVSVVVLALIVYRQLQVRPLNTRLVFPIILTVIGMSSLRRGAHGKPLTTAQAAVLVGLLVIDAGGLGALRALTVRLWHRDGILLRQGSWLTAALWLLGLAIHETVDAAAQIGSTSLFLYLGITWIAQRLVLQQRAKNATSPR